MLLALLLPALLLPALLLLTLLLPALLPLLAAIGFALDLIGKLPGFTLETLLPAGEPFVFLFAPFSGGVIASLTLAPAFERLLGILDIFLLVAADAPQAFELLGNITNRIGFFPELLRLVLTLEDEQDPLEVFLYEDLFFESILEGSLLQEYLDIFQARDDLQFTAANKSLLKPPGFLEFILPGEELPHQRDQPQKTALDLPGKIFLLAIETNRIFRSRLRRVLDTHEAHQGNEDDVTCHIKTPGKRDRRNYRASLHQIKG